MSAELQKQVGDSVSPIVSDEADKEVDRRILIVDDEEMVRNMFADFLSSEYRCTTAASSEEALAHLAVDAYALVISDLQMPGRNGVELLRDIQKSYPDTGVIMVSAIARSQRIRDALRMGAFDYLIKPIELDVLLLSVERALERRAITMTAQRYRGDLERQNIELAARKAELERLQAQIVHNEKMASLGQLAAGIAHELNNPAAFIYGNLDLLQDYMVRLERLLLIYDDASRSSQRASEVSPAGPAVNYALLLTEIRLMLADCREGAERIRDVVQNLRLFSRLDEADIKPVDIPDGIDSTIRLLSRYYGSGRINIHRNYCQLPLVNCYAGQLNQVWMNLLVNAAQAITGDGEVHISTREEDGMAIIEISDSGCGIPAEQLSKIFDPFFTTKPIGEGTGLGLSIIYGIIEKHHGTISVASDVDVGSKFTISIPIDRPAETDPDSTNVEMLQQHRVLEVNSSDDI